VLRALVDDGVRAVAMEASSHALDQRRLDGIAFSAAVFTNLTRDHLDYHETMEAYFEAKAHLVGLLSKSGTMIVNADDRAWDDLPPLHSFATYGFAADAGVRAINVRSSLHGSHFTLVTAGHTEQVTLPLLGDFNVSNALAAIATAIALGASFTNIVARLGTMPQVPGRLERLSAAPVVLRDYAHTPDALERALTAIRPFATRGRVIVVFGCGGDRDPGKRPVMGGIAERLADHVILTSDNPRTEDPEKILDAIEAGMTHRTHERIEDRRAAIARAIEVADRERDIVLLAGKGHETYQVRGTEKLPFDEAQIVSAILAGAS
jgi:UDP-N-acetylmuramoyl-L-alanyl-D-glutamate--2,6-diaminopimelate ligase